MALGIFEKIAGAIGSLVGQGVKPILDKFVGDKMSDADKAMAQLAIEKLTIDAVQKEKDSFHSFVLEHTGAAKDMPRFIQVLRGSVRPVITYSVFGVFVWFSWWTFNNISTITDIQQLAVIREVHVVLKAALIIVLGFWFGERLLTRTGLGNLLLGRKADASSSN